MTSTVHVSPLPPHKGIELPPYDAAYHRLKRLHDFAWHVVIQSARGSAMAQLPEYDHRTARLDLLP